MESLPVGADMSMSYEDIVQVKLAKKPKDHANALAVHDYNTALFEKTHGLYRHLCDLSPNGRLSSETVTHVWFFVKLVNEMRCALQPGTPVRQFVQQWINLNPPVDEPSFEQVLRVGHYFSGLMGVAINTRGRLPAYLSLYDKLGLESCDDPVEWYVRNGKSLHLFSPTDEDISAARIKAFVDLVTDRVFDPCLQE